MRPLILLGPVLLLAACGGNGQTENTINADQSLSAESFSSNDITAIDAVTGDASNMAADVNYVTEADNAADSEPGSAPGNAPVRRRPAGDTAAANESAPEPEPAANTAATANNSL